MGKTRLRVSGGSYSVDNPRVWKSFSKWVEMTPVQRYEIMKKTNSQKKSANAKFHDYLRYIDEHGV